VLILFYYVQKSPFQLIILISRSIKKYFLCSFSPTLYHVNSSTPTKSNLDISLIVHHELTIY